MDPNQLKRSCPGGRPIIALLLCATVCALGTPARAVDTVAPAAPGFASGLNLTPQQLQKLSTLENSARAQADQLTARIKQLRSSLAGLYRVYTLDSSEAKRLNSELNTVQGQLLDLRLSEQVQLRAILTADQFAQLQAKIKQNGPWGDRHGRSHGDRGGGRHSQ